MGLLSDCLNFFVTPSGVKLETAPHFKTSDKIILQVFCPPIIFHSFHATYIAGKNGVVLSSWKKGYISLLLLSYGGNYVTNIHGGGIITILAFQFTFWVFRNISIGVWSHIFQLITQDSIIIQFIQKMVSNDNSGNFWLLPAFLEFHSFESGKLGK